MIRNEATEKLLADLVRIESVTPWLIPDGSGERAAAAFVAAWAADLPVEVEVAEIAPGRVNTLMRLPGAAAGPTLCVNAHLDTVGFANWRDRAIQRDDLQGSNSVTITLGCARCGRSFSRRLRAALPFRVLSASDASSGRPPPPRVGGSLVRTDRRGSEHPHRYGPVAALTCQAAPEGTPRARTGNTRWRTIGG